jgi:LysM repeat protein
LPTTPAATGATATSGDAQAAATTPEQMNAASPVANELSSPSLALQGNPLRPSNQTTPPDRYAESSPTTAVDPVIAANTSASAAASTTTPSAPVTPAATGGKSFVEDWPAIQGALERGELAEAHKQLSHWYGDPSLTPTDSERVNTLLSQLAGTVVYSTEHRLGPAHVVKQGETMETIAQQYNIPAQLLAKINGVAASGPVHPGQELKVVRGPFSAVVDLSRNELTLMVEQRYAGKFPVTVAGGQSIADGEWVVGKKSVANAPGRALLLQGNAAAPGTTAPMLIIASQSLPINTGAASTIQVTAQDAEELTDILSIGSRVITRR